MQASSKIFFVCGLWLVALGTYFLFLRPALLPEDPRYIGRTMALMSATNFLLHSDSRWLLLLPALLWLAGLVCYLREGVATAALEKTAPGAGGP